MAHLGRAGGLPAPGEGGGAQRARLAAGRGLSHEDEEWAGVAWGKGCTDRPGRPLGGRPKPHPPAIHQTSNPASPPFQDINFSEKKMLFVFFPGKILIMGLMCLSCFCVSRGLFQPGCSGSRAPAPQPPAADPPSAAPVSAESGGCGRSARPPRAPHLRLHKARHSPPSVGRSAPRGERVLPAAPG